MSSPALPHCLRCKRVLPGELFNRPGVLPCPSCGAQIHAELFPAFLRPQATGKAGELLLLESEAGCFYHPEKKAEVSCESCGRFLCALCDCELNQKHFCPSCLQAGPKRGRVRNLENERMHYDSIALALAVLPIITIWFTLLTAPAAVYMALRYWNAPRSIVGRTRIRFILAIVFGVGQVVAWVIGIYYGVLGKLMANG